MHTIAKWCTRASFRVIAKQRPSRRVRPELVPDVLRQGVEVSDVAEDVPVPRIEPQQRLLRDPVRPRRPPDVRDDARLEPALADVRARFNGKAREVQRPALVERPPNVLAIAHPRVQAAADWAADLAGYLAMIRGCFIGVHL